VAPYAPEVTPPASCSLVPLSPVWKRQAGREPLSWAHGRARCSSRRPGKSAPAVPELSDLAERERTRGPDLGAGCCRSLGRPGRDKPKPAHAGKVLSQPREKVTTWPPKRCTGRLKQEGAQQILGLVASLQTSAEPVALRDPFTAPRPAFHCRRRSEDESGVVKRGHPEHPINAQEDTFLQRSEIAQK